MGPILRGTTLPPLPGRRERLGEGPDPTAQGGERHSLAPGQCPHPGPLLFEPEPQSRRPAYRAGGKEVWKMDNGGQGTARVALADFGGPLGNCRLRFAGDRQGRENRQRGPECRGERYG